MNQKNFGTNNSNLLKRRTSLKTDTLSSKFPTKANREVYERVSYYRGIYGWVSGSLKPWTEGREWIEIIIKALVFLFLYNLQKE